MTRDEIEKLTEELAVKVMGWERHEADWKYNPCDGEKYIWRCKHDRT